MSIFVFVIVYIEIPSEIVLYRIFQDVCNIAAYECDMVLETMTADVLHEALQMVYLGNGDTSVHAIGVVGNLTLTHVSTNLSFCIVC